MPMPTYVNERPVKTGCWTEREDELLAEWQGKYGNRFALPHICHGFVSLKTLQLMLKHTRAATQKAAERISSSAQHARRWCMVAKKISGRTGQQCAQRWRHKVSHSVSVLRCRSQISKAMHMKTSGALHRRHCPK